MRYIAFLRGINVGSHTVKMDRLRSLFIGLGLDSVGSYINSGNIFFDSNDNRSSLTARIESTLSDSLGFAVPTFLRSVNEVENLLHQEPFRDIKLRDDIRLVVTFTNEPIDTSLKLPQYSSKRDIDLIGVNEYEAFLVWHIINGRPPSGKFPKDIIPKNNTSRFYHTVVKILNAAQSN